MINIKIFHRNNCVTCWNSPDFFADWMAKTFNDGRKDENYHTFPLGSIQDLYEKLKNVRRDDRFWAIPRFLEKNEYPDDDDDDLLFISGVYRDLSTLKHRFKGQNVSWQMELSTTGYDREEPQIKEGFFTCKIVDVSKGSHDSGYGSFERSRHDAQYFLYVKLLVYGFPFRCEMIKVDVRDEFCALTGFQRISERQLECFKKNNRGKKLSLKIRFRSNQEWKWDPCLADFDDFVRKLDFSQEDH